MLYLTSVYWIRTCSFLKIYQFRAALLRASLPRENGVKVRFETWNATISSHDPRISKNHWFYQNCSPAAFRKLKRKSATAPPLQYYGTSKNQPCVLHRFLIGDHSAPRTIGRRALISRVQAWAPFARSRNVEVRTENPLLRQSGRNLTCEESHTSAATDNLCNGSIILADNPWRPSHYLSGMVVLPNLEICPAGDGVVVLTPINLNNLLCLS